MQWYEEHPKQAARTLLQEYDRGTQRFSSPVLSIVQGKENLILDNDKTGSYLYVHLTLTNAGPLVKIKMFYGRIKTSKIDSPMYLSTMREGFQLNDKKGNIHTFHRAEDSLEEKAARGVGPDHPVTGWLKFDLGNAKPKKEELPSMELIIKCQYESGEISSPFTFRSGRFVDVRGMFQAH